MTIFIISVLWLLTIGAWAAAPLWSSKCEKTTACLSKCAAYRGYAGLGALVLAILVAYQSLLLLLNTMGMPLMFVLMVAQAFLLFALGVVMGQGILTGRIFANSEKMKARFERWNTTFAPYEQKLGVASIVVGVLMAGIMIVLSV